MVSFSKIVLFFPKRLLKFLFFPLLLNLHHRRLSVDHYALTHVGIAIVSVVGAAAMSDEKEFCPTRDICFQGFSLDAHL